MSLNLCVIQGRLTRDPELRRTGSGIPVASFCIAVDRDWPNKETGEKETDFINCVAWRQKAEFVNYYFRKGSLVVVSGRLQIRKWTDNDGNNRTLSIWNVSSVKNMSHMFRDCNALTSVSDLSNWNVSSVTNMGAMFNGCKLLASVEGLSGWNVSSVTDIGGMFSGCNKLTSIGDLSDWKVISVTDMHYIFQNCSSLTSLNLSGWDVSSVTDMGYMFNGCSSLDSLDLNDWDVSSVTTVSCMFQSCSSLTSLDISGWELSVVTDTTNVFNGCSGLVEIKAPKSIAAGMTLSLPTGKNWYVSTDTSAPVTEIGNDTTPATLGKTLKVGVVVTFNANGGTVSPTSALVLNGESITLPTPTRVGYSSNGWYTAATEGEFVGAADASYTPATAITLYAQWTSLPAYFNSDWKNLLARDINSAATGITTTNIKTIEFTTAMPTDESYNANNYILVGATARDSTTVNDSVLAYYYKDSDNLYHLAIVSPTGSEIYAPTSCQSLFEDCTALTTIEFNSFITTGVTGMGYMFSDCCKLISLDLSGWDVSSVEWMFEMFCRCYKLESLDLSGWDVSSVDESMSGMFSGCSDLTSVGDLSNWNVSSVTGMRYMFSDCNALTSVGDLSGWNLSSVTDMSHMFYNCNALTSIGDLSGWNVSSVTDMSYMFYSCKVLTSVGDLSDWDVSSVTNMRAMFAYCSALTSVGDLSGWNVSSVTDMSSMFRDCYALTSLDLSGWNVYSVTNMNLMFSDCSALTSVDGIGNWNVSRVTGMSHMFGHCYALTSLDLSGWKISSLADTSHMFYSCNKLVEIKAPKSIAAGMTLKLPTGKSWFVTTDTSAAVTEIGNDTTPETLGKTLKVGVIVTFNANGGSVTPTSALVLNGNNITLPTPTRVGYSFNGWYTEATGGTKVGDAGAAYTTATAKTIYAQWVILPAYFNSNWKNLLATDINGAATGITKETIKTIEFTTSMPTDESYNAANYILVGAVGRGSAAADKVVNSSVIAYYYKDGDNLYHLAIVSPTGAEIYAPTSCSNLFKDCTALTTIEFNSFNTTDVTTMYRMFAGSLLSPMALTTITGLSNWDVSSVTNMSSMFSYCKDLTSLEGLSDWNVSSVTDMSDMFYNCELLTSVGNLSGWNVSSVTDMTYMFYNCKLLTSVGDLSGWNVSSVTYMGGMFTCCHKLSSVGNLSGWNVSSVTYMGGMFSGCELLTSVGDLSDWDVSSVTYMGGMFTYCHKLTSVGDLSGWDVSSVTDMSYMFSDCNALTSVGDLSDWDVSSVTDMSYMFSVCELLTSVGDLSDWDVSSVTDMGSMFSDCNALISLNLSGWELTAVTSTDYVFYGCSGLVEIKAPKSINPGFSLALPGDKTWIIKNGDGTIYTKITNETGKEKTFIAQ